MPFQLARAKIYRYMPLVKSAKQAEFLLYREES
jgi:hypothetical protein